MTRLLTALVSAALALSSPPSVAGAYGSGCADDYYSLTASLYEGRAPHAQWISHLEANPGAYIPPDVHSLAAQREKVALYDARLWAAYYIATGDHSRLEWLRADFAYSAQVHREWAAWLSQRGNDNDSWTLYGVDPVSAHLNAAWTYELRIQALDRMTWECAR